MTVLTVEIWGAAISEGNVLTRSPPLIRIHGIDLRRRHDHWLLIEMISEAGDFAQNHFHVLSAAQAYNCAHTWL
jgi:hypothetical protein